MTARGYAVTHLAWVEGAPSPCYPQKKRVMVYDARDACAQVEIMLEGMKPSRRCRIIEVAPDETDIQKRISALERALQAHHWDNDCCCVLEKCVPPDPVEEEKK